MVASDGEFEAMYRERLRDMILARPRVATSHSATGNGGVARGRALGGLWRKLEAEAALVLLRWSLRLLQRARAV